MEAVASTDMIELNEKELMMVQGGGVLGSFTSGFIGGAATGGSYFAPLGPAAATAGAISCGIWAGGISALTSSTIYNF